MDACGYNDPEDENKVGAWRPYKLHSLTLQTDRFVGLLSAVV